MENGDNTELSSLYKACCNHSRMLLRMLKISVRLG